MLHKNHAIEDQNAAMRQKQDQVLSENQQLKGKVIDLRGKLTDRSMLINHLECKPIHNIGEGRREGWKVGVGQKV